MTLLVPCRARLVAHPSLSVILESLLHADPERSIQLGPSVWVSPLCPPQALDADPAFQVHAIALTVDGQVQHWAVVAPHGAGLAKEDEGGPLGGSGVWDLMAICPQHWHLLDEPHTAWTEVPLRPRAVREPAVTAALAPVLMALGLVEDVPRVAGHLAMAA